MNAEEKAQLLISSIDSALAHGVKHYDMQGRPLNTTKEILQALVRDKRIRVEESKRE